MSEEIMRYQQQITELENKVSSLEQSLIRLAILVEPNKKHPYWHELLRLGISEEQKMDLEFAMFYLTSRLNQEEEFLKHKGGDNAYRFPTELFNDGLPSYDETMRILSVILKITQNEIIESILLNMRKQGMFKDLIGFLIPEIRSNT